MLLLLLLWATSGSKGRPVAMQHARFRYGASNLHPVNIRSIAHAAAAAGSYEGRTVAVKIFIADVSPDGSTAEEMAINCAVQHPNLTRVLALVVDTQQNQQQQQQQGEAAAAAAAADDGAIVGLVLELVHGKPLADRPTSEHLLRCK
jgi:hypothetical protein